MTYIWNFGAEGNRTLTKLLAKQPHSPRSGTVPLKAQGLFWDGSIPEGPRGVLLSHAKLNNHVLATLTHKHFLVMCLKYERKPFFIFHYRPQTMVWMLVISIAIKTITHIWKKNKQEITICAAHSLRPIYSRCDDWWTIGASTFKIKSIQLSKN